MLRIIKDYIKALFLRLPSTMVLVFHHVSDNPRKELSRCKLNTREFYDIIDSFNNYRTYDELINNCSSYGTVVTFDDGLEDLFTVAYPYLKQKNVPFIVFVISDYIDNVGYLTKAQLVELAKDPLVTIGSHSKDHGTMSEMQEMSQYNQAVQSKAVIEKLIGRQITTFAYPHGQFNRSSRKVLRIAEYQSAFSVNPATANLFSCIDKYKIPRYNVDYKSLNLIKEIARIRRQI